MNQDEFKVNTLYVTTQCVLKFFHNPHELLSIFEHIKRPRQ